MIPSPDLNSDLEKFLSEEAQEKCEKCAFVVPVYEISANASKLPENKTELIELVDQELAREFHLVNLTGYFYKLCHTIRVHFTKVGRMAQIIEKALSICALRLCRTIMPVKSFSKVGCYALHRAPNFMKLTLWGWHLTL